MQQEQKFFQFPLSLDTALPIGFSYFTAVAAPFPRVSTRGKDRVRGDLAVELSQGHFSLRVQPKQEPFDRPHLCGD